MPALSTMKLNRSATSVASRAAFNCALATASSLNAEASTPFRARDDLMVISTTSAGGARFPASTVVQAASPALFVVPAGHTAQ